MPLEDTSTGKAEFYETAYRHAILDRPNCLGSYVFYRAEKQEKTHTWYGMFLPDGSRTESIDHMTWLWTGKWPANRSPRISRIFAAPSGTQKPGGKLTCQVNAVDPDGDPLRIAWDLRLDVSDNPNVGGDYEDRTPPLLEAEGARVVLTLPQKLATTGRSRTSATITATARPPTSRFR